MVGCMGGTGAEGRVGETCWGWGAVTVGGTMTRADVRISVGGIVGI